MAQYTGKSFTEALAYLGTRTSRKIANNTYMRITEYDDQNLPTEISISYHGTDIVVYDGPSENVWTTNGSYYTSTTKSRLNEYTPLRIWQRNYVWYVDYFTASHATDWTSTCEYNDTTFNPHFGLVI